MKNTVQNSFLKQVGTIIGDRTAQYKSPLEEWTFLGKRWGITLGLPAIDPHIVGLMMLDLKVTRLRRGYHHDSAIDVAGYANCLHSCQLDRETQIDNEEGI